MAFWGVEVKSGKSVTHSCVKAAGRLRLSQATLGFGDATKKSVVQCNIGGRSPVLLCVLLPNKTESCHLDLEFEESVDVVFSVIGPRSVFLTGYYVQQLLRPNLQSDTESYGEDIENTQSEESAFCTDDDEYEDSFIDDEELRACPTSPKETGKVGETNTRRKRLVKMYKIFDSDSDTRKSQDENDRLVCHEKTGKALVKNVLTNDVDTDDNIPVNKKASASEKGYKMKMDDCGHELDEMDQKRPHDHGKQKKKKIKFKDEKIFEVGSETHPNNCTDSKDEKTVLTPADLASKKRMPWKKRKRELHLEDIEQNGLEDIEQNGLEDIEHNGNIKQIFLETTEQKDLLSNRVDSKLHTDDIQPETKKTTKEGERKSQGDVDLDAKLLVVSSQNSSTLSNGLIIEEISFGPPDGKVASAGKSVKIYYTVTSKETNRVFYTNVGKSALKFLLGRNKDDEGWKSGISGMRVGDKRRITVPPSLSGRCGELGAETEVNSWLVYEVELLSVRKVRPSMNTAEP